MNKSLRFIGLVNISLIAGVVISLSSGYVVDSHPVDAFSILPVTAGNHSEIASNLQIPTAHAEHGVTTGSHSTAPSVKTPFHGFSFFTKGTSSFIVYTFSSKQYYLQNVFVRLLHIDLIFPFHYFW